MHSQLALCIHSSYMYTLYTCMYVHIHVHLYQLALCTHSRYTLYTCTCTCTCTYICSYFTSAGMFGPGGMGPGPRGMMMPRPGVPMMGMGRGGFPPIAGPPMDMYYYNPYMEEGMGFYGKPK